MASKNNNAGKNAKGAKAKVQPKPRSTGSRSVAWIAVAVVIIAAIAATGLFLLSYNPSGNKQVSFNTFMNNFVAANSVGIYVSSANMSAYPSAISCATALIENIEAHAATHKNSSDIGFYVMNQTMCTYKAGGLGSAITNYTNTTPSSCLALSTGMPRIFINYSSTNSTVVKPYDLYVSGTPMFLDECGIASVMK